jgi:cobalamin biosynthesis protein CobC
MRDGFQDIRQAIGHGGDLARAEAEFGAPPEPWLDLSTGLNPSPYPLPPLAAEVWSRLPDSGAMERLIAAATVCYEAPDAGCVVAAPGTQALIQLLPRLRSPGRVEIVGPTYGEHRACWSAAGHRVREASTPRACNLAETDVVVVTNPNNPDGRRFPTGELAEIAAKLADRGGWVVVDEAFADPTPEASLAGRVDRPGIVVLRSFGKFFGLGGLRLGFALAAPPLATVLRSALGPWCVSGPAAAIGATALGDAAWVEATRKRLPELCRDLDSMLEEVGLPVVGGTALFRLVDDPRAPEIHRKLAKRGVLVRRFADRTSWLRFGLPRDRTQLERLRRALAP